MIPRILHFVSGLKERPEPFHFVHYAAIESARRVIEPDAIYLHHGHAPFGPWWDRVADQVVTTEVRPVPEVDAAGRSRGRVPARYLYAHHADFVRLDALIATGGIYSDLDVVFVRPPEPDLLEAPFVLGAEAPVRDELTGHQRPSLCNAVMMSEPGSAFAREWRSRMAGALNGTWSNHSGFLSEALTHQMPDAVRVVPEETFFPFPASPAGLAQLFLESHEIPQATLAVHLWAHLWWERSRRDMSPVHAAWATPSGARRSRSTWARLVHPYLPGAPRAHGSPAAPAAPTAGPEPWLYLSLDESSGYGVAADRYRDALEDSGQPVDWIPMLPAPSRAMGYAAPAVMGALAEGEPGRVVVAHLVPEYLPAIRAAAPDAYLVANTVWETDRLPARWPDCLAPADLVVVPSRLSADAVRRSGAQRPVEVVPYAVGRPSDKPLGRDRKPADRLVFYTVAEWNERKAPFLTIEAYLRAFSADDPVLLVVKTSVLDRRTRVSQPATTARATAAEGTTARALAELLGRYPGRAEVVLVTAELSEGRLSDLHRHGDCFVSLCRSEGWGLGAFDAAAAGNPVVTTGFGGHLDYLADSSYLVDFELSPVVDPVGVPSYTPDQRWAQPDLDHGASILRRVADDPAGAFEAAEIMAGRLRHAYRPAAVAVAATFSAAVSRHRAASVSGYLSPVVP